MRPLALLALLAAALLAACGSRESGQPSGGYPAIRSEFQPGQGVQVIEILVLDPIPLDGAELVLPDGRIVVSDPVSAIWQGRSSSYSGGGVGIGVGVFGGSASGTSGGVGLSLPVFGFGGGGPAHYESRTRVVVPDMELYRQSWPYWQLRLRFGNPLQGARYYTVAPPPPPAG